MLERSLESTGARRRMTTTPSTKTPVILLTGFLGSGKTTLLNALLKAPQFANTAVVVNEFGAIGLDHFLIEQSRDNIVLLEAGCLCCTISDSLHETLAELNAKRVRGEVPAFTRVVIETTGLADPAPILNTLLGNRLVTDHYQLEAAIVTVDAQHVLEGLERQPEVAKQIAVADRLVLTKTDLLPASPALFAALRRFNALAPIVESTAGQQALAAFAPIERHVLAFAPAHTGAQHGHEAAEHAHDVNRHDAHIRAACLTIPDPASWAGLAAWWRTVSTLFGDRLLRCKGVLRIAEADQVVFVQGVQRIFHRPERLPGWPDEVHASRLVCILRDVTDQELQQTLSALQLPPGSDPETLLIELSTRRARS